MRATLLCLLTASCNPAPPEDDAEPTSEESDADADADTDSDTDADSVDVTLTGTVDGEGFGSAVAFVGQTLFIGAPHGTLGRVYTSADGGVEVVLEAEGRAGAALSGGDILLIGAPLTSSGAGAVLDVDGTTLYTGDSAGLALGWDTDWLTATGTGWRGASTTGTTPARPTSLATVQVGGVWQVGVGMAHGPTALLVGDASFSRSADRDEAGYALAAGDIDGDGEPEWLLGAPGAGRVDVLSTADLSVKSSLTGTGRFGAAIAVADIDGDGTDDVLIGAPTAGDNLEGAAHLFTSGDLTTPAASFTGEDAGDQLGFSVALTDSLLAIGAPGTAATSGRVEQKSTW